MATQPLDGPSDNDGMKGHDRRRQPAGDIATGGGSTGTPGRRTLTGGALPRTTHDLASAARPTAHVLESPDARVNGRPVAEIDGELRNQLVALAQGSTRIMQGLLLQKRMMQDSY